MTQTPASTSPAPTDPAESVAADVHPGDILMQLIVGFLTPLFLTASAGNVGHARIAAIETVDAYQARNHTELIAIAQVIAFGLTAVGSLSLSMAGDIPVSMALRLRGNANALNRSAEQNRRALRQGRASTPPPAIVASPETPASPDEPDIFLQAAAAQQLAAEAVIRLQSDPAQPGGAKTLEKRHQEMWAIAMVKEASDIAASLVHLPPAERKAASIRAAALGNTANQLLTGGSSPPLTTGGGAPG